MAQSPAVINAGRQSCAFGMGLGYVDKGCQIVGEVSVLETLGVFLKILTAEEEGFEPPVRVLARTADFESAPFVHSGTPPTYILS